MKTYSQEDAEKIIKEFLVTWREELKSSDELFTNITRARISPNPRGGGGGSYLSFRSEQSYFNCDISFSYYGITSVDYVNTFLEVDTCFLYPESPKQKSSIEAKILLSKIDTQPGELKKVFKEWIKTELMIGNEFKTRLGI